MGRTTRAASTAVDYSDMERYLEYLEEHGRRPSTIENTRILLRHILRTMAEHGRPTTAVSIRTEDVEWVFKRFPGVSDQTRCEYAKYVSRMCVKLGGPDHYRLMDTLTNRPTRKRTWITLREFGILYRHADPTERMILVLGALMGIRRFEIAGLRDEDIDLDRMEMTIRGKGHGPDGLVEVMDIPEDVAREIVAYRDYKAETAPTAEGSRCLVQALRYGRWKDIAPGYVSDHVRLLGRRVGIHVATHSLRRLYATTLVNEIGAELDTVRRLMRHADVSTTLKCYVQADPRKLKVAMMELTSIMGREMGVRTF